MNRQTRHGLAGLLACFLAGSAWAGHERSIVLQGEPPVEPNSNLVERVVVPQARLAVVSDVANLLVVARQPGTNEHLYLFPLDAAGHAITSTPVKITLPRPAAISGMQNFALSLAVHPSLPLLYVWQDVAGHHGELPTNPQGRAVYQQYDHLQIYQLEGGTARLLLSTGHGEEFTYMMFHHGYGGAIALDLPNHRFYVPNLRDPRASDTQAVVGFAGVDEQGLPVLKAGQMVLTTSGVLLDPTPPAGFGWVAAGTNRVVFVAAGSQAIVTWDLHSRRAALSCLSLAASGYHAQLATHPTLPMMYIGWGLTWSSENMVHAIELADGFPTLLPQELVTPNESGPIFLPKLNRLAIGSAGRVLLVKLTADGWFTRDVSAIAVGHSLGEALAYSPKFDRLYVPVESLP